MALLEYAIVNYSHYGRRRKLSRQAISLNFVVVIRDLAAIAADRKERGKPRL